MSKYELTVVLPGDVSAAKKKTFTETFDKLLKIGGGKIAKEDNWGKLDLSYNIKKNTSGTFLHFLLDLDAKSAKFLHDKLRLEDSILRYLLIKS